MTRFLNLKFWICTSKQGPRAVLIATQICSAPRAPYPKLLPVKRNGRLAGGSIVCVSAASSREFLVQSPPAGPVSTRRDNTRRRTYVLPQALNDQTAQGQGRRRTPDSGPRRVPCWLRPPPTRHASTTHGSQVLHCVQTRTTSCVLWMGRCSQGLPRSRRAGPLVVATRPAHASSPRSSLARSVHRRASIH